MSGMLCKLSYANNFKDVSVDAWFHLYFGAFNRCFHPKQLTNSYTDAHQEQFGVLELRFEPMMFRLLDGPLYLLSYRTLDGL